MRFLLNFLLNLIEGLARNVGEFCSLPFSSRMTLPLPSIRISVAIPLLELGIGGSRPADIVRKLPCENRRIDRCNPEVIVGSECRSEVAEIRAQRFNFGNGGLYVFAARIISARRAALQPRPKRHRLPGRAAWRCHPPQSPPSSPPRRRCIAAAFRQPHLQCAFRALFVIFIKVCLVGKLEIAKAVAFGNEEILRLEQFRGENPSPSFSSSKARYSWSTYSPT